MHGAKPRAIVHIFLLSVTRSLPCRVAVRLVATYQEASCHVYVHVANALNWSGFAPGLFHSDATVWK